MAWYRTNPDGTPLEPRPEPAPPRRLRAKDRRRLGDSPRAQGKLAAAFRRLAGMPRRRRPVLAPPAVNMHAVRPGYRVPSGPHGACSIGDDGGDGDGGDGDGPPPQLHKAPDLDRGHLIRFPWRLIPAVVILKEDGEWFAIVGSNGWSFPSRSEALIEAVWLAANFGLPIRFVGRRP